MSIKPLLKQIENKLKEIDCLENTINEELKSRLNEINFDVKDIFVDTICDNQESRIEIQLLYGLYDYERICLINNMLKNIDLKIHKIVDNEKNQKHGILLYVEGIENDE